MEKPLSIKREDFIQALIKDINECGLPPFAAFDILRDITREAETLARRQLEQDRIAWERSQKEDEDGADNAG